MLYYMYVFEMVIQGMLPTIVYKADTAKEHLHGFRHGDLVDFFIRFDGKRRGIFYSGLFALEKAFAVAYSIIIDGLLFKEDIF